MKTRLLALALAGALALALCACGAGNAGGEPTAQPTAAETPPEVEHETLPTAPADAPSSEQVTGPMLPTSTPAPTPEAVVDPTAPPSQALTSQTPASQAPASQAPDSQAPASEVPPQNEAATAAPSAAAVSAAVSRAGGVSYDDASAYIDAFYTTLNTADLADYAFSMPPMSTQLEELFVARVKSGRMDAVKAACRDRQAALAEDAAFYGTTGAYVDGYQLLSQGDWLLFYVGPNAGAAVGAFQNAVK